LVQLINYNIFFLCNNQQKYIIIDIIMLIKNNEYQIFYINSYNRLSGTNSNFSYKLPVDQTKNFNKVIVLQASVPKSYYLVSAGYNTFILRENSSDIIITVPVGNYNKDSFQTVLSNLLTSNSLNGWVYTITSPNALKTADTSKYTILVSGNSSQPSIVFTNEHNNCYELLGLNSNSTNTFVANTLTSTNVINFSLESTLFIHSDICQNRFTDNVLQEIYTPGVSYNSFIRYECITPEFYAKDYVGKSDIYQFYLTDENGNMIDTNGLNINITLCIFRQTDIDLSIENYIEVEKMSKKLKLMK